MKCEIKQCGSIHITPETELEAYALNKWADENMTNEKVQKHLILEAYSGCLAQKGAEDE